MKPEDVSLSESLEGFQLWNRLSHTPEHREVNLAFVSVGVGGTLGINKAAYEMFGRPSAVRLMFDPERRRIGIKPISADHADCWELDWGHTQISCRKFFEYYGLTPAETTRYTPKIIDGVLIIEL